MPAPGPPVPNGSLGQRSLTGRTKVPAIIPRPWRRLNLVFAFLDEAEIRFELKPRSEFGVVALAATLGFPKRAAGGLSIPSRVAGRVAHVIEQRLSNAKLRPRAKVVK